MLNGGEAYTCGGYQISGVAFAWRQENVGKIDYAEASFQGVRLAFPSDSATSILGAPSCETNM